MRVLVAISIIAFLALLWACIAITIHIYRIRKNRHRIVPAEPPRNVANTL